MPSKIQNPNVVQEVKYVKQEAKLACLLECLRKIPCRVLVFCESDADVHVIHEYLLVNRVKAVSIQGGKDQGARDYAVSSFLSDQQKVLVGTDVASKGLEFPKIQHVINYDMPADIENYVDRIGKMGRYGKTAMTFINHTQTVGTLMGLKHLLLDSKQKVPSVLAELVDPMEYMEVADT